jgi:RimJ/RimL family protein N-acetyltransferase
MTDLALRRAGPADEELLLSWRNDAATRAASFSQEPIDPATHHAWLERALADPDTLVLIAEEEGRPVAQVRVNRTAAGIGEIHVVVAPEARGRGVARSTLVAGTAEAAAALEVREVLARVKPGNPASLRAFRSAGFGEQRERGGVVELRWRGTPGGADLRARR